MAFIKSLTLLLLIGAVQPAPRSPFVHEVADDGREFQQPSSLATDAWSLNSQQDVTEEEEPVGSVLEEEEEVAFPRDFERRVPGDVSFDQLIRRLLEQTPRTYYPRPEYDPFSFQDWTPFNINPYHPTGKGSSGHDEQGVGSPVDEDYDDYDIFSFDRPTFFLPEMPKFPAWHNFPDVDNYPDNYDNSTHEVHVVNGTRIEVNKTISKESGDGFNSFFHHEVVNFRPDQDAVTQVPGALDQDAVTQVPGALDYDTTIISQGEEDLGVDVEGEDKKEELPSIPEVENEVSSSGIAPVPIPARN